MAYVKARPNESIDDLLGRFKKAVERSGVLSEVKRREFYEKPSVKRKRKQAAARKRELKKKKFVRRKNVSFKWSKDKTQKLPMKTNNNYKGKKPFRSSTNTNFKPGFKKPNAYKGKAK